MWDTLVAPDDDGLLADLRPGRAGAAAGPPVPLLQPGVRPARPAGRPAPRRHVGGGPGRPHPGAARPGRDHGAADRPGRGRIPGGRVLRPPGRSRSSTAGRVAPAAQLWSTAADMAKWAAFLADPATVDPGGPVLAAATVEEMRWPVHHDRRAALDGRLRARADPATAGRQAGRARRARRRDARFPGRRLRPARRRRAARRRSAAAALGSSGTASAIYELPHDTARPAVERTRPPSRRGRRASRRRSSTGRCSGRWWSEGNEYVFAGATARCRPGRRTARRAAAGRVPRRSPEAGRAAHRVRREAGELLRLSRDEHGGWSGCTGPPTVSPARWRPSTGRRSADAVPGTSPADVAPSSRDVLTPPRSAPRKRATPCAVGESGNWALGGTARDGYDGTVGTAL